MGGGLVKTSAGFLTETIFDLPLQYPPEGEAWLQERFFAEGGQPIYRSGIAVDKNFHPIISQNRPQLENLSIIGSSLANADPIRERSLEGIALATGYSVGEMLGETL